MSARDAILSALADRPRAVPERIAAEARALLAGIERPATPDEDLAAEFLAKLSVPSIGATHDWVPDWSGLPTAVARYLHSVRVERRRDTSANEAEASKLYIPPDPRLTALDWSTVPLLETIPVDDAAALAIAVAGVAETGTLVLDTAPTAPMLPNFLALHHIVAVERATIVRHLDDVPPPAAQPRTRYWVTGVSGTTDIEGQYVRGAHGPRFLHVVIVG